MLSPAGFPVCQLTQSSDSSSLASAFNLCQCFVISRCLLIVTCRFAARRQLRQSLRFVSVDCFRSLVARSQSQLDYINFVLVGSPAYRQRQRQPQSVLSTAAGLTLYPCQRDHVIDALTIPYWLQLPERINHKLPATTYRSLHGH